MHIFKKIVFYTSIVLLFFGCSSTKDIADFEEYLYPEGRFFTIKQPDNIDSRKFDFYFIEANRLKMLGDIGSAAMYYHEALKIDSTCATCYYEVGNLLIDNGEFEEAENYLFNATQLDPDNKYFVELLSQLYQHNGKDTLALSSIRYLVQRYPQTPEYHYYQSQLSFRVKRYQEAVNSLYRLENIIGANESLYLERHSIWSEAGEKKRAEDELKSLIDVFPDEPLYRVYLGDFYIQEGNKRNGYRLYTDILDDFPDFGPVWFSLSSYYLGEKDTANFKKSLKEAYRNPGTPLNQKVQKILPFISDLDDASNPLNNEDIDKYLNLLIDNHSFSSVPYVLYGNFNTSIEKDSIAMRSYETALLIDDEQEDVWHEFLFLASDYLEHDELIDYSLQAVAIFPENPIFNYFAGVNFLIDDQYSEAKNYLIRSSEIVEDNSSFLSQIYGILGDVYFKLDDPDNSFKYFEESLSHDGNNIVVLNNYAYYLSLKEKDLDRAEQMITRVIELEPDNPTYLDTYAWVLFKQNKFFDALFVIEQAIEYDDSNNGVILEHYGDILYRNGKIDEAVEQWKKALETGDDELTKKLPLKIENRTFIEKDYE
ncbi:tetratricopeptide repeat protein [Marinilabiliaceae bacterium ANBcel2]|nr:tetratricopeptide repeat protein [Marinilabiliaceae bacterium ANBcel2]